MPDDKIHVENPNTPGRTERLDRASMKLFARRSCLSCPMHRPV